jgi:hypothetical protein
MSCENCKKLRKQIKELKNNLEYVEESEAKGRAILLDMRMRVNDHYNYLITKIEGKK